MVGTNPIEMMQRFNQFKQAFQGDPKKEVERLISNGQISQQQLNQLQQMASQFVRLMNGNLQPRG